ncbi:MAG: hypothetical protein ACREIV_16175, partial [Planctomycetaceae bacterium]
PPQALSQIETAEDRLAAALENIEPAERETAEMWSACQRYGQWLKTDLESLPGRIAAALDAADATAGGRTQHVRAAQRALRLLDPRDTLRTGTMQPQDALRRDQWARLLAWHRNRFLAARDDAPERIADHLTRSAQSYRSQAEAVPDGPVLTAEPPSLVELRGTSAISLETTPERRLEFTVNYRGSQGAPVWIVLEYDPGLIEVAAPADRIVYHEHLLQARLRELAEIARSDLDVDGPSSESRRRRAETIERAAQCPYRPDLAELPPTYTLRAGRPVSLSFAVRSRARGTQPTRLIVKAIAGGIYVRTEVPVTLPHRDVVELVIDGTPGTWSYADGILTLHPFPNR